MKRPDRKQQLEKQNAFEANRGFYKLFWLFVIGSVAGFVLEGVWSLVHWGHWAHHAGVVWGPFCTIYGLGCVAMELVPDLLQRGQGSRSRVLSALARYSNHDRVRRVLAVFLVCAFAGSLVEYLVSLCQEVFFGSVSWDYSDQPLNLGGRVSVLMTLVWGVLGVVFMEAIAPRMTGMISGIHGRAGYLLTWCMIGFMTVNLLVSAAAVSRWHSRTENKPARNLVEAALDESFNDERMERLFPNMQFTSIGSYSYDSHAATTPD